MRAGASNECRAFLRVAREVKRRAPDVCLRDGWSWQVGPREWEFHYEGFWWRGWATSETDATRCGWLAYLLARQR